MQGRVEGSASCARLCPEILTIFMVLHACDEYQYQTHCEILLEAFGPLSFRV